MEHTKAWVVSKSHFGFYGGSSPVAVFFSKQEAEFFKWDKDNAPGDVGMSSFYSCYYSINEVQVLSQEKNGKRFEKFKAEKLAKIEKEISEKNTHSAEDLAEVERLQKEKEALKA